MGCDCSRSYGRGTYDTTAFVVHQCAENCMTLPLTLCLPADLWHAVLTVVTTPPVSDFLAVGLWFSPQIPPLPAPVSAWYYNEVSKCGVMRPINPACQEGRVMDRIETTPKMDLAMQNIAPLVEAWRDILH